MQEQELKFLHNLSLCHSLVLADSLAAFIKAKKVYEIHNSKRFNTFLFDFVFSFSITLN
jgi:hypothetical protein